MLTIHVWPRRLKEFLLTHPLYKSPLCKRLAHRLFVVLPGPSFKVAEDEGEGLFAFLLRLQGALPHDDEVPAIRSPRLFVLRVAADVAAELGVPELAVGLRTRRRRTDRGLHELSPIPLPAMLEANRVRPDCHSRLPQ